MVKKPTKPTNKLPNNFGGVKKPFSIEKVRDGFKEAIPDILEGGNLNYLFGALGENLEYLHTITDFIHDLPINKLMSTNANNQLEYIGLDPSMNINNGLLSVVWNNFRITLPDNTDFNMVKNNGFYKIKATSVVLHQPIYDSVDTWFLQVDVVDSTLIIQTVYAPTDTSNYPNVYRRRFENDTWSDWEMTGGNGTSLPLFFFHHFDSLQNDSSWLKADTFSWQSGKIYWAAYNQLTEEFAGTTATTETVADIAITFYRTATGKKICLPDQESQIMALYAATGAAWYYILDSENKRFKLPRNSKRELLYNGSNSNGSYEVYSDGWIKQGKYASFADGETKILLPKKLIDSDYTLLINRTAGTGTWNVAKGTDSFMVHNGGGSIYFSWVAEGYGEAPAKPESPLYFYVGNTVHDAKNIYAGKALEQLAGKADVDFNNIDAIGKNKLWGDLSVGYENDKIPTLPRGGEYTAPSNGCIACYHGINGNSVRILFGESDYPVSSAYTITTESNGCSWRMKKGQKVKISYSGNQANVIVYFFPQGD